METPSYQQRINDAISCYEKGFLTQFELMSQLMCIAYEIDKLTETSLASSAMSKTLQSCVKIDLHAMKVLLK